VSKVEKSQKLYTFIIKPKSLKPFLRNKNKLKDLNKIKTFAHHFSVVFGQIMLEGVQSISKYLSNDHIAQACSFSSSQVTGVQN